jgi:hypothetical protein
LTTSSCSASGIFAICCDLTRPTITRLARTFQSTRTRRRREQYIPLVAFCLRHFLADFIICMCEFDFRQAHPSCRPCQITKPRVFTQPGPKTDIGPQGRGPTRLRFPTRRAVLGFGCPGQHSLRGTNETARLHRGTWYRGYVATRGPSAARR